MAFVIEWFRTWQDLAVADVKQRGGLGERYER